MLFTAGAPTPMFLVIFHQILHVVLGDELCNSVWALSGGRDLLPCPNVPSKWKDRLGQADCQYGTFGKLRTSCPCEVEFEVALCFFEGGWCVHRIAVWECFDIGTWTRRISSYALARWNMKRIGHRIFLLLSSVRVKNFVNAVGCLFVREENKNRVFCLSLTGWIVSIGAADEELRPCKFCAKIGSARGVYVALHTLRSMAIIVCNIN